MTGKPMDRAVLPNFAMQQALEALKACRRDIPTQGPPLSVLADRLTFLADRVTHKDWCATECIASQRQFLDTDVADAAAPSG